MGRNRGVLVSAAATAAAILALGLCGCAPADPIDEQLRSYASTAVAGVQDLLWESRHDIVADPELALSDPELGLTTLTDARALPDDPPSGTDIGSPAVLDVAGDDDGARFTLAALTSAETGGGWWYRSERAYTCFTVAVADDSLETAPSDCGTSRDKIERLFFGAATPHFLSLDDVVYRPHVDAADHPAPPCQCYSGSPCDCPGG